MWQPLHVAGEYVRGRRALVTGGSEGIGFAIARRLAMYGAKVTLLARDPEKLEFARAAIEEQAPGTRVRTLALDVADEQRVRSNLPRALGDDGLDLLINCAGTSRPGYFADIPAPDFRRQLEVNLGGAVHVTRALLERLAASARGHIVNVGSVSSVVATLGHSAYAASKFALYGWSDVLRAELKSRHIRVSIVLPPETSTKMLDAERPYLPKAAAALQGAAGRLTADDVARSLLRGIARGQFEIVPGVLARATVFAFRTAPGCVRLYADWVARRAT